MSEPLPDEELRALFRTSKEVPAMPAEARARVRARLHDVTEVAGPGKKRSAPGGSSFSGRTVTAAALSGIAVGVAIGWTLASAPWSQTDVGARSGTVQTDEKFAPAPEQPPRVVVPAPPDSNEHFGDPDVMADPPKADPPKAQEAARHVPRSPNAPGSTLAAERRLIDAAFAAIRRGNAEEARRSLDRHASRFPDGLLGEEREELRIRVRMLEDGPP